MTTVSLQLVLSVWGACLGFFGVGYTIGRVFEAQSWWRSGWKKRE